MIGSHPISVTPPEITLRLPTLCDRKEVRDQCSPDLTPLDFLLWGHLTNVYASAGDAAAEMLERVPHGYISGRNTPGMFQLFRQSMHCCA
jgi:hypothetical protein